VTLDDNPRCVGGGMQDLFAADAPAPLDASAAPTDEATRRVAMAARVDTWVNKARVDAVTSLDLSVHWKTLTSWLTAHLESERARDPHLPEPNTPRLDLDLLGATVGRKAKVVRRKEKLAVRGRRRK
jgi:hypothetical protein